MSSIIQLKAVYTAPTAYHFNSSIILATTHSVMHSIIIVHAVMGHRFSCQLSPS